MVHFATGIQPISIKFTGISYCINEGKSKGFKTILKEVSGQFQPGQLTAILGPSGAGKTSLMSITAGYRTSNVAGTILINNNERDLRKFRKLSCYIMQEDHLLPFLTVMESMDIAASLKLGDKVTKEKKQEVINEVLTTLNLRDCKNTRVANLSGGEKKRLSIAQELVNNPPVLFFDEPTSGLDSRNSLQCINTLRTLANNGKTIVCTIHQPSARIFESFDYLIALADGHCIYQGALQGLIPFLSLNNLECPPYHNPADYLVEVASGEYGNVTTQLAASVQNGEYDSLDCSTTVPQKVKGLYLVPSHASAASGFWQETAASDKDNSSKCFINGSISEPQLGGSPCEHTVFITSDYTKDSSLESFAASSWTQFRVLFKRTFISIIRDKMLTKLRIIAHTVVGILIGLLYFGIGNEASKVYNNAGCLFFCMLFLIFSAMMPTILTFPLEMNTFVREHVNHWYSLKSYYMAKTMADMPFQIIYPLVTVLIMYFMTDQPPEALRFMYFTVLCMLTSLVAQSLGLTIGAAATVQESVFFGPVSAIPLLLFSGFFVTYSTIPIYLRWISYVSYIRYGFEGILIAIYGHERDKLHCSEAFCYFKVPTKYLEALEIDENMFLIDFLLLLVHFIVFRVCGYFVLKWKLKTKL